MALQRMEGSFKGQWLKNKHLEGLFSRKHTLEQMYKCTVLYCCFSIFWKSQALFVNLEQFMACCNDLISHLCLVTDRKFPWAYALAI